MNPEIIILIIAGLATLAAAVMVYRSVRDASTPDEAVSGFFDRLDANFAMALMFMGAVASGVLTLVGTLLHSGLLASVHVGQLVGDWPIVVGGLLGGAVGAAGSSGHPLLANRPLFTFGICLALLGLGIVLDAITDGDLAK